MTLKKKNNFSLMCDVSSNLELLNVFVMRKKRFKFYPLSQCKVLLFFFLPQIILSLHLEIKVLKKIKTSFFFFFQSLIFTLEKKVHQLNQINFL